MKDLFKPAVIKVLIIVLSLFAGIKLMWLLVSLLWLSPVNIDEVKKESAKALYYHVKLTPNDAPPPIVSHPVKHVVHVRGGSIADIHLLAIYSASDMTVVTVEYKHGTKVLVNGDTIAGFTLESAENNYAVFSKESKNYKVRLVKTTHTPIASVTVGTHNTAVVSAVSEKKALGTVTDAGDHKVIDRSLLNYYADNINEVYKNIGIGEVKKGNDVVGFRVNFVRRDSPFAKLGIRRNDVLKSINGQPLDSYSAAFSIYKNIKDMNNMNVVIERGDEEMELEYEVN